MKRFMLLIAMLLPVMVFGQQAADSKRQHIEFDDLVAKYESAPSFRTTIFGSKMLSIMGKQARQNGDKQLAALLDDISYIKTISTKQLDSTFIADALAVAAQQGYQIISAVEENGRKTSFYIAEYYAYSDFLMLSFGQGEWIVMGIRGRFDVSNISRLTNIKPRM